MVPSGTLEMNATSQDVEVNVLVNLDFSQRHEIAAGAKISSVTWRVLLDDSVSTALTTASSAISVSGKIAQVKVTDVRGVVGDEYLLSCKATLDDGTVLVEGVKILIQ